MDAAPMRADDEQPDYHPEYNMPSNGTENATKDLPNLGKLSW